jgi:uncharacterized protein
MTSTVAKIVITGAFNAGKSQFVRTISEIAPVQTERRVTDHFPAIKTMTTAAMDYGRFTLGERRLHLYGTPGQERFAFMWDVLARRMDAYLVLIDSSAPTTFVQAHRILQHFQASADCPAVVVANKQDRPGALAPEAIHTALDLPPTTLVVPCVATDSQQVRAVLETLVTVLPERSAFGEPRLQEPVASRLLPIPPARVVAVHLGHAARKRHLTVGDGLTLCQREVPESVVPVLLFTDGDCQRCRQQAVAQGLACTRCQRPLTRSTTAGLCLGCARQMATTERDTVAFAAMEV